MKRVREKIPVDYVLKHWQKVGGGSLRLTKPTQKIIKPGEKFWMAREYLPDAFMDTLIELDDSPNKGEVIQFSKESSGFELKKREDGLYDVVDSRGKVFNESPIEEDEAKKLIKVL